jgi:uncharacterized protein
MLRTMEKNKDFPNLLQALFVLVALLAVEIIVGALYIDLFGRFKQGDSAATGVIIVFASGIVFACLMAYKSISFAALFQANPASDSAMLRSIALPIILLFAGLSVVVDKLMQVVLWLMPMTQAQYDMFSDFGSGGAATLLAACVVAPFVEEMLFRGIFLRSFLHQYSKREAIVFSSLLFGIAHLNVYQGLVGLILGSLLGWLYVKTRSLWPSIAGHAVYNLAVFIPSSSSAAAAEKSNAGGIQFIAILFAFIGAYMLWKRIGGVAADRYES